MGDIEIPEDVRGWIRNVFKTCNAKTAISLMQMPNTHEAALDMAFVSQAAEFSAPVRFPSEWIVRVDTHFLGGRRHFNNWEIADIGVLINFRQGGKLVKSKIVLLQSKRLYPKEQDYEEDERIDYEMGFARLFRGDGRFESITAPRVFAFDDDSRYQALKIGDEQYVAIEKYEEQYGIPVYYMLYHPGRVPFETVVPRVAGAKVDADIKVGARVLRAADLRSALASKVKGYSPFYRDLKGLRPDPAARTNTPPGWVIEEFLADLSLDCKVGYVAEKETDQGVFQVFNRRSGPISAAIAVTFDAPKGTSGAKMRGRHSTRR